MIDSHTSRAHLKDDAIMLASEIFSRWVLSGNTYDVDYSLDPPWDCSGRIVKTPSTPSKRLSKYEGMGQWMEDCLMGESTPSYESGCGLYHDTFSHEVEDRVLSLAEGLLIEERGLDKNMEDVSELVGDDAVELWAEALESIEKVSTEFAWEIARFQVASEAL